MGDFPARLAVTLKGTRERGEEKKFFHGLGSGSPDRTGRREAPLLLKNTTMASAGPAICYTKVKTIRQQLKLTCNTD